MIQTKAFHVKHYLDLEVDEFMFADSVSHIPESVLYRLAESPFMKTICNSIGSPIMVIGVVPVHIGIGEVFILPGKGWIYDKLAVCRIIRDDLRRILMFHHRIQATCKVKDKKSARFLEMFGFQREGTLRHYNADGDDFYMYSLISGD